MDLSGLKHLLLVLLTTSLTAIVNADVLSDLLAASESGQLPQIIDPSDPSFADLRKTYIVTAPPLAIARPKTADEVSALIKYVTQHSVPFTIRAGGHELYGRSVQNGTLDIDLRLINETRVLADKKHALLGGGVSHRGYGYALAEAGYITPFSTVVDLGLGWSLIGGYSLYTAHLGLGIDQIVGAKVVDWKGDLVEADADLLFGLRGGGGNLGVVVELTVKIYPLKTPGKKILAGTIFYNSTDIATVTRDFFEGYEALENAGIPLELGVEPSALNIPNLGRVFNIFVASAAEDLESLRPWVEKLRALGQPIQDTVAEITIPEWLNISGANIGYGVYGDSRTSTVRSGGSGKVKDILARNIAKMTSDPSTLFYAHRLRGPSAQPDPSSSFGLRYTHWMLELVGGAQNETGLPAAQSWSKTFHDELEGSGETEKATYIALTKPGDNPTSNSYGENWDRLLQVKRKFDPNMVFRTAVPSLVDAYA